MAKRTRTGESGQASVLIAMSMLVMCGMLGLVVDIGWANWRKEACKTAAEAAAQAAVAAAKAGGSGNYNVTSSANCSSTPTNSTPLGVGCMYAKQNGYTHGVSNRTVSYQAGTTSGAPTSGIATTYWVSYTVSEDIWTTFSAVLGRTKMSISSRATSAVIGGGGGGCIYILASTGTGLNMVGSTSINSGCGIYVNSTSNSAVNIVGSGTVTTTGGSKTNIVGNYSITGSGSISPVAITGASIADDPFAGNLPTAPTVGSCQATAQYVGSADHTIPAGTYCNQISSTGSGDITLTSGTYILQAGVNFTGSGSLNATGPVTIYVAGGSINFTGSGGMTLSAPTSGLYNGILIWQPSTNTSAATMTGSAGQILTGVVYMPGAGLSYTGSSSADATSTTIVVRTLTSVGSAYISAPATSSYGGGAPTVYLIE